MGRTVLILLGMMGPAVALGVWGAAAQDLDAGKSPAQLFSNSCAACHRGPQGLGAGRDPRAVAGFLAQHYTSSRASAAALAGYLVGVGGDPRAARARTRTEPPTVPQAAAPQGAMPQAGPGETPGRAVPQGPQAAPGAVAVRTPDPEEARAAAARERQKRRERREAIENARAAEQRAAQAARPGLPSVSSDPPPAIVSVLPIPVPAASAGPATPNDVRTERTPAPAGARGPPEDASPSRQPTASGAGAGREPAMTDAPEAAGGGSPGAPVSPEGGPEAPGAATPRATRE